MRSFDVYYSSVAIKNQGFIFFGARVGFLILSKSHVPFKIVSSYYCPIGLAAAFSSLARTRKIDEGYKHFINHNFNFLTIHEKPHQPTNNHLIQTSYCYSSYFRPFSTTCTNQYFSCSFSDPERDCAGLQKHLFSYRHYLNWGRTQKPQLRVHSNFGI